MMNKSKWLIGAMYTFLVISILSSCNKPDLNKISGIQWDPNLATPIGYADFGVYDVLAAKDSNDLVIVNPLDGALALTYDGQIVSVTAQDVIPMNNLSQQFSLVPSDLNLVASGSFNGSINSSNTENIDIPTSNGIELHTVEFNSGSMNINVSTTLEHDITLNITFPDLISSGSAVTKNINLSYGGSVPQVTNSVVDLSDVIADYTAGGSTVNRIRANVNATITGTGQPIAGNENFDMTIDLSNMVFKNAIGYFGQQTLGAQSDSILIKIFNNATTGTFSFTNPSLKFTIDNSFGMPITMNFANLESINTQTGQVTPLTGYPSTLAINAPTSMGQTATTSMTMNTSNTTNLSTIISPTPKYLNYSVSAATNPAGQTGPLNFIEAASKFEVNAELTLPLEGYAYGFSANDTMPYNFSGNADNIESAMFRFNVTNGFPVSVDAQATFVDANYIPIFSLVTTPVEVVSAAPVNSSGKVTSSVNKITDVTLNKSQINLLDQVKYVIISGTGATTTPQQTVVKLYDGYRLAFKIGMQVQLKVD